MWVKREVWVPEESNAQPGGELVLGAPCSWWGPGSPGGGDDEKLGGGRPHSVCPVPFRAGRHRGDPQQN